MDWLRHDRPDLRLHLVCSLLHDIPGLESNQDPPVVLRQVQVRLPSRQGGRPARPPLDDVIRPPSTLYYLGQDCQFAVL